LSNIYLFFRSGFEHVLIGETKNGVVSGFHNWLHFYYEENEAIDANLNYMGWVNQADFGKVTNGFI
jgi:hypothetical protein